jgi:hypothetical protein
MQAHLLSLMDKLIFFKMTVWNEIETFPKISGSIKRALITRTSSALIFGMKDLDSCKISTSEILLS